MYYTMLVAKYNTTNKYFQLIATCLIEQQIGVNISVFSFNTLVDGRKGNIINEKTVYDAP
jgi:hypothetical protein